MKGKDKTGAICQPTPEQQAVVGKSGTMETLIAMNQRHRLPKAARRWPGK